MNDGEFAPAAAAMVIEIGVLKGVVDLVRAIEADDDDDDDYDNDIALERAFQDASDATFHVFLFLGVVAGLAGADVIASVPTPADNVFLLFVGFLLSVVAHFANVVDSAVFAT